MDKGSKKADRLHRSTTARKKRSSLKEMRFFREVKRFARLRALRKKRKKIKNN